MSRDAGMRRTAQSGVVGLRGAYPYGPSLGPFFFTFVCDFFFLLSFFLSMGPFKFFNNDFNLTIFTQVFE